MAASSNTGGQPKYGPRNARDVQPAPAASGQQVYPLVSSFDDLRIASTSGASSSGTKQVPYDVFINHHRGDVKHMLANSIYNSLDATGLRVFFDKNELKLGDFFPRAIEEVISSSSLHIAIFSEHYAQSPWCLAELAFMVQTGTKIIPVYYHVEPSTLRWAIEGKGMYADALSEYEMGSRYTSEQLQHWKWALHEASFVSGEIINNECDEQRVVKNVVYRVTKEMNKVPLEVAKHPVGLNEAVRNFDTIALQSTGSIQIVGISGVAGSGKTALAKEIFNERHSAMDWSSFLSDIRDAGSKGLLIEKQQKLLKDLDVKDVWFDNVELGKQILKRRLSRSVSVLIVLDDVDHIDQLDALLPSKESLGHRSLIIVTTRDPNVLQKWGISAVYPMRSLNATHAKQLFCWHAFLQKIPPSEFEDLVEKFLNACQGLPLSLEVLGGQLYGRSDKDYWQRTFNKFSQISHEDIKERLKVSYDALEEEDKQMFLDTACFFVGERKSVAIAIWDASGWNGLLGWETLFNKCLVELDKDGCIRMHDHLRDLGRHVANGQSPHRLWSPQEPNPVPFQQKAIRIRGMAISDNWYPRQGKIIMHPSLGECSLAPRQIFVGDGNFINQEHSEISRELLWLQCNEFEHKNLLSWLSLKRLRILELSNPRSLEDLWQRDEDAPLQLRELVIQGCESLRGFPRSIGHLNNLKKMLIGRDSVNCDTLSSLPEEFCRLQSLEHLEIKRCRNLSSLPNNFGDLTNLRHLDLKGCAKLRMLPDSLKNLTLLKCLNLEGCDELTIKSELHILENMRKLRYLNLDGCSKLEHLSLPEVCSLRELYLQGTSLKKLPANISRLTKLNELLIGSEFVTTLPTSLGDLSSLSTLKIQGCKELKSLPDSLEHLIFLRDLCIEQSGVECLPKSFIHLKSLKICQTPISELSFGSGCTLERIYLQDTKVSRISISEHCCPSLETLSLSENMDLVELETLPATLKSIDLHHCKVLKNISGVSGLNNLQNLQIDSCDLDGLPSALRKIENLQRSKSLVELNVSNCPELEELPSLLRVTSLKKFQLEKCQKLKKIEGLESLRSLETLNISDCQELDGLPSLARLTSLKNFKLLQCHKLEKIEGLERLTSLEKLEVHTRWKAPCIGSLEHFERLRSLVVVENDRSAVKPFVSNIQKWPREVIICTRAVFDVGSLKNFFELPNVSVLDYSDVVEIGSNGVLLRRPESSANANAILICFIIDCVYPDLNFSVSAGIGDHFDTVYFKTELGKGKWVWMGVFTQGSEWLRSNRYQGSSWGNSEDKVNVKVEEAWLVMGEEGSILEVLHQLFQRKLPRNIKQRLKISYDALDEEEKQMFLDTACFFIGEEKSLAIAVWDGSGWSGLQGWESLINKDLVYLNENNRIRMHDHLKDLGREIADQQSPYRLWCPWQFNQIQLQQEHIKIRGMINATGADCNSLQGKILIDRNEVSRSPVSSSLGLKLLVGSGEFLNEEVGELSRELLWLRWDDFNRTNLPPWLSLKNLRVLELNGALNLQELWTDDAHAPLQLRELIITGTWSASFERFPRSISYLKHLKKIALLGYVCKEFGIKGLPEEFCDLPSLEHLELRHCKLLSTLPTRFGELPKLRHLDLFSCEMLRKLPDSFKQLVNLKYLDLSGCKKLSPMPDILQNVRELENLYFSGCPKMKKLPLHIAEQKNLRELHLKKTMLRDVPNNIDQLSKLETLVIGSLHLTAFPVSLGNLSSLTCLKITRCIKLESLPDSVERLKLLEYLCIKSSGVRSLPEGFKQLTNLQKLTIFDCPIAELDFGSGSSSSLGKLKVIHLKATDVTRLSISQNCCPNLETLQLELNRRLVEIDILSTSVKMVKVYECTMLRDIKGFPGLVNPETFEITGCPELDPDTIQQLRGGPSTGRFSYP